MRQADALAVLQMGHNVFLTGAAGAGKTWLLNQHIRWLREHGVGVAVTASTGIAATHLNGQTIHSWSGIGVRSELDAVTLDKLAKNRLLRSRFKKTSVLVIDEISMLHAFQLDLVDRIARRLCDPALPFGGLQLIVCGDFFQLPPVASNEGPAARFAFESDAWLRGDFTICYLSENHRQGNDALLTVLNEIRSGCGGESTKVPLRTRYKKPPAGDSTVRPTRLYARNINVDEINARELATLPGQAKSFAMQTRGFPALIDGLKRSCLAPENLQLKIGADVMFVKNDTEGRFVNGTRGRVTSFDRDEGWPIVTTRDGDEIIAEPEEWRLEEDEVERAAIRQVPLRLAWAITIHKSQGMTLDAVELDLSDAFEHGMGYVALSRLRALDGLTLLGLNDMALRVHPHILAVDGEFRRQSENASATVATLSDTERAQRIANVLHDRFGAIRGDKTTRTKSATPSTRQSNVKGATLEATKALIEKQMPLADIARERDLTVGTVLSHLEKLKSRGTLPDLTYLKSGINDFEAIYAEWKQSPDGHIGPIRERLGGEHSYDTLKLVRLFLD